MREKRGEKEEDLFEPRAASRTADMLQSQLTCHTPSLNPGWSYIS
jgi:hypothetical protein